MHLLSVVSLKNRALIALVTVVIAVFGVIAMGGLKQELAPNVQFPQLAIVTTYQGASPDVVKDDVSTPVEKAIRGVPGLESTSATSSTNTSVVSATFTYGTDLDTAEQKINQQIDRISDSLPDDVDPEVMTGSLDDFPIMQVAVSADQDDNDLNDELERIAVPDLEDVDGVREASVVGADGKRVTITPDDDDLSDADLTTQDISETLDENGTLVGSGEITEGDNTFAVQAGKKLHSVDELKKLPMAGAFDDDGDPITLGDVATVKITQNPTTTISRVNGEPALTLSVTKMPDANTVDVSEGIRDVLPDLEESLGHDADLTIVFDQAPFIEESIESLSTEGLLGLLFAVVVILIFLLDVRATIVTAISIPTSVLITFIGLEAADYTLNILTLGALTIAIGRVVDDSIVVIENIKRHLGLSKDRSGPARIGAIGRAVREVAGAITASTITTVAVFLPMAFVGDMTGELFRPFALTVTIALLASLLVALTIVPVLAYWFLRAPSEKHMQRVAERERKQDDAAAAKEQAREDKERARADAAAAKQEKADAKQRAHEDAEQAKRDKAQAKRDAAQVKRDEDQAKRDKKSGAEQAGAAQAGAAQAGAEQPGVESEATEESAADSADEQARDETVSHEVRSSSEIPEPESESETEPKPEPESDAQQTSGSDSDAADDENRASEEGEADEAGTDKAGTDEVSPDEASTDEAGTDEADSDKANAGEADADEADADEADADEADADEADAEKPDPERPDTDERDADEASTDEADTDKPDTDASGTEASDRPESESHDSEGPESEGHDAEDNGSEGQSSEDQPSEDQPLGDHGTSEQDREDQDSGSVASASEEEPAEDEASQTEVSESGEPVADETVPEHEDGDESDDERDDDRDGAPAPVSARAASEYGEPTTEGSEGGSDAPAGEGSAGDEPGDTETDQEEREPVLVGAGAAVSAQEAEQSEPAPMSRRARRRADDDHEEEMRHPTLLQRGYLPIIRWTLRHSITTLLLALLVMVVTLGAAPLMKTNFIGSTGENTMSVTQTLDPGASLDTQDAAAQKVEDVLLDIDGIDTVQVSIGGDSMMAAFTGGGDDSITYSVTTDEDADQDALQNTVRDKLDDVTDAGDIEVSASGGFGVSSDIEVDITATNADDLQKATDSVSDKIGDLGHISQVTDNLAESRPFIEVSVDRKKAAEAGYTETALSSLVAGATQPQQTGDIVIDGTTLTIYLASDDEPTSIDELKKLEVPTPTGTKKLTDLADVTVTDGPASITTTDTDRSSTVTATPAGDNIGEASTEVTQVLDGIDLPAGATAEIGGVASDQDQAFGQMGLAMLAAILIVYIVMVATFRSLRQPLLLLVSVPFAATGGVAMQLATGVPLGVPSLIGVLMLIGIVVTNAIVLVDLVNQYRRRGLTVVDALVHGSVRRLRPILMTALATIFALTPMALGITGQGGFISQPLAIVVIGGLVSSTVLTLVVLPTLYNLVEGAKERRQAKRERRQEAARV